MRWWLGISLAVLIHSPAMALDGLVMGLSEDQLLSCSQRYIGQVQLNGKTFHRFVATTEVSMAAAVGSVLPSQSQVGCEAIVGIENGKVAKVETKQLNESLLSCFACQRIFSDCKFVRR